MYPTLAEAAHLIQVAFGKSELLRRLGFLSGELRMRGEDEPLPNGCHFIFRPVASREIDIWYSCEPGDGPVFTVEIYNTALSDSFLLEEWMSLHGSEDSIHAGYLDVYGGSFNEQLAGYLSFLEGEFGEARLYSILKGRYWVDIPFNWGNLR